MKGKKIVFVGFMKGYGGAERSMLMVANGLAELGHKITVISLKENKMVYEINNKIDYIFIPDSKGRNLKNFITRFKNLSNILSCIKPDIVISFWFQPAFFTAILSKFIGFKTIYSERGDPSDNEYSGLLGFLRMISFKFIDGFVFQTKGAKEYFSKTIQNRSIVINNSVSIKYSDYSIPKIRKKVIVNVGRLHQQKNQQLLINSFAKISPQFPEYKLEIYGEGELEDNLKEHIKNLGLENKVYLKGTTKNLFEKIVNSSLFVLSSNYEGMPNALMEAMALGIPCISTDCSPGGARELISTGKNGIIVPKNSEYELAKAIKYMLENSSESERMGRNAKEICFSHSEDKIILSWEKYILKVINI